MPAALPDELLGAWLLRVADLYGTGLRGLMVRLGAATASAPLAVHWFELRRRGLVDLAALAVALHRPVEELAAMDAPGCQPRWPPQPGFCPQCLANDCDAGRPPTWYRRWMHPAALACAQHHAWLAPVSMQALRAIQNGAALADFVAACASTKPMPLAAGEAALIEGALWVEQSLTTAVPTPSDSPFATSGSRTVASVINALLRLLAHDGAAGHLAACLGASPLRHSLAVGCLPHQTATVRAYDGKDCHLNLPAQLQPRQALLGAIGTLLRQPPGERAGLESLPRPLLARLVGCVDGWPLPVIDWVSIEAGRIVRQAARLRARHGVSPRYFQACAALLDAVE